MRTPLARAIAGLVFALTALTSSSCYRATFIDPKAYAGEEHEEWTDFFVFGLVNTEEFDVRTFCHGSVARVRTGSNLGTTVISLITIGIYTPRKVYVTCASGRAEAAPIGVETDKNGTPVSVRGVTRGKTWVATPVAVKGRPDTWRVHVEPEVSP